MEDEEGSVPYSVIGRVLNKYGFDPADVVNTYGNGIDARIAAHFLGNAVHDGTFNGVAVDWDEAETVKRVALHLFEQDGYLPNANAPAPFNEASLNHLKVTDKNARYVRNVVRVHGLVDEVLVEDVISVFKSYNRERDASVTLVVWHNETNDAAIAFGNWINYGTFDEETGQITVEDDPDDDVSDMYNHKGHGVSSS